MKHRMWMAALALMLATAPAYAVDREARHAEIVAKRAELFAQADANGDGVLTPSEFATFRQLMETERQSRWFARADADHNGTVTLDELAAAGPPYRHGPGGRCGK